MLQTCSKSMHENKTTSHLYFKHAQPLLPQIMYYQPTKQEEYYHAGPEYPLVLLRPPLHHPNRIPTNPQRISHTINPLLCPLQHLPLLP